MWVRVDQEWCQGQNPRAAVAPDLFEINDYGIGSCFLLPLAGIDTIWSAIGSGLWHLATRCL